MQLEKLLQQHQSILMPDHDPENTGVSLTFLSPRKGEVLDAHFATTGAEVVSLPRHSQAVLILLDLADPHVGPGYDGNATNKLPANLWRSS